MADPRRATWLPCPECATFGVGGAHRMGVRKSRCSLCNTFAQAVRRRVASRLRELYPEQALALKLVAETDLYPQMCERWSARNAA